MLVAADGIMGRELPVVRLWGWCVLCGSHVFVFAVLDVDGWH